MFIFWIGSLKTTLFILHQSQWMLTLNSIELATKLISYLNICSSFVKCKCLQPQNCATFWTDKQQTLCVSQQTLTLLQLVLRLHMSIRNSVRQYWLFRRVSVRWMKQRLQAMHPTYITAGINVKVLKEFLQNQKYIKYRHCARNYHIERYTVN